MTYSEDQGIRGLQVCSSEETGEFICAGNLCSMDDIAKGEK